MFRTFPARIFAVALVLRLIPVLLLHNLGIGLDDMFQYDMLARSLALGNGFRWYAPPDLARLAPYLHMDQVAVALDPRGIVTTFRAPLYPAFLSVIYAINGINDGRFFAARLAQTVLGALLAPLTYFAARNIFSLDASLPDEEKGRAPDTERIAVLAAWITAAYPMLLLFPLALATENLFFVLVLASVIVLLQLARVTTLADLHSSVSGTRRTIQYSLFAGFLLGLAALTRSVILPFAGLAILWIWLCLREARGAIFAALALTCTIAPWIVRNSLVSHQFTGIETSMGYNLYVGYHPQSTGTFAFGPSLDLLSIPDDKVRDEVGTQQALAFIRRDPARVPYLAIRRLGYFFDMELRAFTYFYVNGFLGYIPPVLLNLALLLLALPFVIVSLSAVFGTALLEIGPPAMLLTLLLAGYLVPHILILSEERFHLVLIPFLAILAAAFWTRGFSLIGSRSIGFVVVSLIIAVLLLTNWGFELSRNAHVLSEMLGPNGNQLYLPY